MLGKSLCISILVNNIYDLRRNNLLRELYTLRLFVETFEFKLRNLAWDRTMTAVMG